MNYWTITILWLITLQCLYTTNGWYKIRDTVHDLYLTIHFDTRYESLKCQFTSYVSVLSVNIFRTSDIMSLYLSYRSLSNELFYYGLDLWFPSSHPLCSFPSITNTHVLVTLLSRVPLSFSPYRISSCPRFRVPTLCCTLQDLYVRLETTFLILYSHSLTNLNSDLSMLWFSTFEKFTVQILELEVEKHSTCQ